MNEKQEKRNYKIIFYHFRYLKLIFYCSYTKHKLLYSLNNSKTDGPSGKSLWN